MLFPWKQYYLTCAHMCVQVCLFRCVCCDQIHKRLSYIWFLRADKMPGYLHTTWIGKLPNVLILFPPIFLLSLKPGPLQWVLLWPEACQGIFFLYSSELSFSEGVIIPVLILSQHCQSYVFHSCSSNVTKFKAPFIWFSFLMILLLLISPLSPHSLIIWIT